MNSLLIHAIILELMVTIVWLLQNISSHQYKFYATPISILFRTNIKIVSTRLQWYTELMTLNKSDFFFLSLEFVDVVWTFSFCSAFFLSVFCLLHLALDFIAVFFSQLFDILPKPIVSGIFLTFILLLLKTWIFLNLSRCFMKSC